MNMGLLQQISPKWYKGRSVCDLCGALLDDVDKHVRWHGVVRAEVEHALIEVYHQVKTAGVR